MRPTPPTRMHRSTTRFGGGNASTFGDAKRSTRCASRQLQRHAVGRVRHPFGRRPGFTPSANVSHKGGTIYWDLPSTVKTRPVHLLNGSVMAAFPFAPLGPDSVGKNLTGKEYFQFRRETIRPEVAECTPGEPRTYVELESAAFLLGARAMSQAQTPNSAAVESRQRACRGPLASR